MDEGIDEMIDESTKGWREAGLKIMKDPAAQVMCPTCHESVLKTEDIKKDNNLVERRVFCQKCHDQNFIRLAPSQ